VIVLLLRTRDLGPVIDSIPEGDSKAQRSWPLGGCPADTLATPQRESCKATLPNSISPEFKTEIVELCRRGDRSIGQVSRDFDLTETAVRARVNQAPVDAGEREGFTSEEREELSNLRRENRSLREDFEVLKRATAFFAKETR
jgi:transposase